MSISNSLMSFPFSHPECSYENLRYWKQCIDNMGFLWGTTVGQSLDLWTLSAVKARRWKSALKAAGDVLSHSANARLHF